ENMPARKQDDNLDTPCASVHACQHHCMLSGETAIRPSLLLAGFCRRIHAWFKRNQPPLPAKGRGVRGLILLFGVVLCVEFSGLTDRPLSSVRAPCSPIVSRSTRRPPSSITARAMPLVTTPRAASGS